MADNIPNLAWMAQTDGSYWYNKNGMTTQEQLLKNARLGLAISL
jgi:hypothetical protein